VRFISGNSKHLSPAVMAEVGQYRHRVFVEKLGWQLQCEQGLEYDQFDGADTQYVIAQDLDGSIIGTARLLPTTGSYLLGDVFPQLMHQLPVPCSDDVWELSRFAAVDFNAGHVSPMSQFSSPIAVGLLHASLRQAASFGAKKLITVSPLGVERLLRKAGFHAYRAAPPVVVDGAPLFACWIDLATNLPQGAA
jgi:acyl homoserine lactone synthase